ncbi:hypothetical protein RA265_28525 [Pseudomonas syringae pv. tagetis]
MLLLGCIWTIAIDLMTVQISERASGRCDGLTRVPLRRIISVRDISALLSELLEEPSKSKVSSAHYSAS